MRKDLNKQLCERARSQHTDHYGNYRHVKKFEEAIANLEDDLLDEPFAGVGSGQREPMKFRHGTKSFNENLNPLYGFIRKSLGRPWNDVYSELCEVFDKRSVINQHILVHLDQYVDVKTIQVGADGNLWYLPLYTSIYSDPQLLKDSYVEYYVDPRDGILKYNEDYKTRGQRHRESMAAFRAREAKVKRVLDDITELHKIDGMWYEIKFETVEGIRETKMMDFPYRKNFLQTTVSYPYRFDVLKNSTVAEARAAVSKRQLNSKQLRKFGLTN